MTEKIKVLLVEDDPNLGTILRQYLNVKGYDPTLAIDGEKGYDEFIKNQREDFEKGQKKERERREKERIITGTSLCSFRILVARIINKEKSVTDSIKLFDFNANAEMNDK